MDNNNYNYSIVTNDTVTMLLLLAWPRADVVAKFGYW